ncbi:MAG: helix-turn-helix domain-containing protein [Candidatus Fournierella pullistercoris]|uniref:Helix-turn-helix domain-containing protein n=1 Tax=Candidatus Allofournierella pullistercoris TaxID=2838597 RepID=A0A948T268_9FIRM|nr:helix-turn-helix domain-containing protein [Candidatus Fournierella pullistercoris]
MALSSRRKAKGLTQKQLADRLSVTDKAVSKWERGLGFPDIKLLEPLSQALDVSILELMRS